MKLYTILGADVYLWPTVIALGFAVLVIFLNFKGAGAAAKLSSFLTKALLAGMILAMVISFFVGSPQNGMPLFSQATEVASGDPTKATSFLGGIIAVLVMTPFFMQGSIPFRSRLKRPPRAWTGRNSVLSRLLRL